MKTRWIMSGVIAAMLLFWVGYRTNNVWFFLGGLIPLRIAAGGFFGGINPLPPARNYQAREDEEK